MAFILNSSFLILSVQLQETNQLVRSWHVFAFSVKGPQGYYEYALSFCIDPFFKRGKCSNLTVFSQRQKDRFSLKY